MSPDTYRHILDALPYGILLADPYENRTVYLNVPLQRMVRMTPAKRPEDVNYRTFLPIYQPWQALARREIAAKEGGHWYTREVRRSDGTVFVAQCLIQPFPLAGERVMMFVLRDLSDPNQDAEFQQQLLGALLYLDGPEFYDAMAARMADAIGVAKLGICRMIVPGQVHTLAFREDGHAGENFSYDLTGAPCEALTREGAFSIPRDLMDRYGGHAFFAERRMESYAGVALSNPGGKRIGHVFALHDDPLIEHEQALRLLISTAPLIASRMHKDIADEHALVMETQLAQAQKLEGLGLLAGGIAHDFNNLLTTILGNVDLVRAALPDATTADPFLEVISDAADRAGSLCSEILDYAGKGRFDLKSVDLNAVLNGMERLLAALPGDCRVAMRLGHPLPLINGDADRLSQVIMNLVRNATEASTGNDPVVEVETLVRDVEDIPNGQTVYATPDRTGPHVCLSVRDHGVGIETPHLARIFDPFFSTKSGGRGLGLAATLGIVRRLDGRLEVNSQPKAGTEIRVLFPVGDGDAIAVAHQQLPLLDPSLKGLHVLVADDDPIVLTTVASILRTAGADVVTVEDGVDAIAQIESARFDCVLLDRSMPRMDGATAYIEINRRQPELPVIVMSGYSEPNDSRLRAVPFVQKPFDAARIATTIRAEVDHARRVR